MSQKESVRETIKEQIRKNRERADQGLSQQELEQDLGAGVEKIPADPVKPDVVLEPKDFFGVLDMRTMVDELSKLPDIKDVQKDMDKYDAYEGQVRKLWVIKKSDEESWKIRMRVIESKDEKTGRVKWKIGPNGKYIIQEKTFHYNPITIQDKEDHYKLLNERESTRQDLLLEAAKLKNLASDVKISQEEIDDYRTRRPWLEKTQAFQKATQDYYLSLFASYFAASEDEMERILFDDIMNYCDVAVYKEQVKSPK